jgi:trehalose 6-phosphate synthase/phosphatase
MSRLLIASNRLPITIQPEGDGFELRPSSGGLATALRGPHAKGDGLWFGWPGDVSQATSEQRARIDAELVERRLVPIDLTAAEVAHYYDGFSNGAVWPLFHYSLDKVRLEAREDWVTYQHVNQRFAEAIAARTQPGDLVWIHDYHLMLVPEYLRRLVPGARIGFFLHIPFPAADVFRILPWREEVLRGLMGADLLGFHTGEYLTNFARSAAQVLATDLDVDVIRWADHSVRLGTFPIGIDAAAFAADSPEIDVELAALRKNTAGRRLILGIDRLDYTKGILRRLLAFERLLEGDQTLHERVQLLQIAVPSRETIDSYADLRKEANELVGRINAAHGTPTSVPVHFLYRSVPFEQLVALYRAADIMLVTPIRDGMNLVAKEYCAARTDGGGVLVLSEFAGAADELREALIVNPYDLDAVERTIGAALQMPEEERRLRMERLHARVLEGDVARWHRRFVDELERVPVLPARNAVEGGRSLDEELSRLREAPSLLVLLDYDGTLVPYAMMPELARPDPELQSLLVRLAARPGARVHVLTGRTPASIERLLGEQPVGLCAEHGYWCRPDPTRPWTVRVTGSLGWKEPVGALLADLAARTPGAFVEEKTSALAFHYRAVDPTLASARVHELRARLAAEARTDIEVLEGSRVIEVRLPGVSKSLVSASLIADMPAGTAIFAGGDDRTDEDLFAALPPEAVSVRVGRGRSLARFRVDDVSAFRALLRELV